MNKLKQTNKYKLGYFEQGDITSGLVEEQRWEAIDTQLNALFSIMGNGVINGWNLIANDGLSVTITPGSGHVHLVAVDSTASVVIDLIPSTTNKIYASLTEDSYWTKNTTFGAIYDDVTLNPDVLYLGYVDTDETGITAISEEGRTTLGFRALVETVVKAHKHIGGETNPPPIDLSSEVQGILNQENLPDIDASMIKAGVLDVERIPQIDHEEQLLNTGTLTHNQLDAFVEGLSNNGDTMGETSTINLLQLILAVKHVYPDIDEFMVNELSYIPGISPDSHVDWTNTTATVDTKTHAEGGTHTISGSSTSALNAYVARWDSKDDYMGSTLSNVVLESHAVVLNTNRTSYLLDDFSNVNAWTVTTQDLSSLVGSINADLVDFIESAQSATINIGSQSASMILMVRKQFNPQNWSNYRYIRFFVKTDSVDHGDLYFYINDASYGVQNSYVKILERNQLTINSDTLENGWQEFIIDISSYNRSSINMMTFYTSTQYGWDTSKEFEFKLDSMSLETGSVYYPNGYVRTVFGNDFPYRFYKVRWDAMIPSDSQSTGVLLQSRVRMANTIPGLAIATWSSYTSTSGEIISIPPDTFYKYIEIEMFFTSSLDKTRTPTLNNLYLDYYASDVSNEFVFDSKTDWESGTLYNIDSTSVPGTIKISNIDDIGSYYYGASGKVVHMNSAMETLYEITGTSLPTSTYQKMNSLSPSLGHVCAVCRGNDGNVWVADTTNDRIVEMDKYGNLVRGFYGSFLRQPDNVYGVEDSGPGSNVDYVASSAIPSHASETIDVLHSIYNPLNGELYIIFNRELENIYNPLNQLNKHGIYVKIGSQRVNLHDATFELNGVEEEKYNLWFSSLSSTSTYVKFLDQFKFNSHVLKISLNGADKSFFNYMVDTNPPSLSIVSPYMNQRYAVTTVKTYFAVNVDLGNTSGQYGIKVSLDSGAPQIIYNNYIEYSGLSIGVHVVEAVLVDYSAIEQTNIEASTSIDFVTGISSYSLPYLSIKSPKANQIHSASPVVVEFTMENFAIVPSGQHVRYIIDSEPPVDHYSLSNIVLDDLLPGKHVFSIYPCDKNGNKLTYVYGETSVDFIVGLNSNAYPILYVDFGSIYDIDGLIPCAVSRTYIDVANIVMSNIYSPLDLQIIADETSRLNDGSETIVIGKMRSQSWLNGLSNEDYATELANRISLDVQSQTGGSSPVVLNPLLTNVKTSELIYGTKYLDGHSVVQMDVNGMVIFSNNAAVFASSKTEAIDILGSVEKVGDSEFMIGDAFNKRAIITHADLDAETSQIIWQYDCDRYVSDFHIEMPEEIVISVGDSAITPSELYIKQGSLVKWTNNSSAPISIYSGSTDYDSFNLDPNLDQFGTQFESGVLGIGESYSFRFVSMGEYDWFVYPDILTGTVNITVNRFSSNDNFYVLENDGQESPFSSRVVKVDSWGNVLWSMGEGLMVKPRDARPMLNGKVLIST